MIKPSEDFTGEIPWVCTSTFATTTYGITYLDFLWHFQVALTMSKITRKDSSLVVICFFQLSSRFTDICFLVRTNLRSGVLFLRGGKERLIQLLDYSSAAP